MPIPHNQPLGFPTSADFVSRPVVNDQQINRTYWTKHQTVLEDGSVQLDGNEIAVKHSTLHIPRTYRLIYSYPGETEYNEDNTGSYISNEEDECGCPDECLWVIDEENHRVAVANSVFSFNIRFTTGGPPNIFSPQTYVKPPTDYAVATTFNVSIWMYDHLPRHVLDPPAYALIYAGPAINAPDAYITKNYILSLFWLLQCGEDVNGTSSKIRAEDNADPSFYTLRCPGDYPDYNQPCVDPGTNPCGSG
jgi:hypothetical protein